MNGLSKLSKRERSILYILTGVIAASLLYAFLLEPLAKRWIKLNQDIQLSKVKLHKSLSIIKDRDKIERDYNLYAGKLKRGGSDEQSITNILNDLEVLARGSNVKIISMRPKTTQDKGYYKRFIVDIETESDMNPLMKFIYEVRNSSQFLKIDRLRLNTRSRQKVTIIKGSMTISKIAMK